MTRGRLGGFIALPFLCPRSPFASGTDENVSNQVPTPASMSCLPHPYGLSPSGTISKANSLFLKLFLIMGLHHGHRQKMERT